MRPAIRIQKDCLPHVLNTKNMMEQEIAKATYNSFIAVSVLLNLTTSGFNVHIGNWYIYTFVLAVKLAQSRGNYSKTNHSIEV